MGSSSADRHVVQFWVGGGKGKGAGFGVGVFVSLELWFLWPSNRTTGLTLTSPFVTLYIMQALSDVLFDCKFLSSRWAMKAETDAA